ncbi:hypothetical protein [Pseudomonas typographi]|uniref:Lipoprotein n=1 Tax=Pseudomonas typographi TaxID=2715964 RepID=A0ABR7ZAK7_9PSED|nr:hypothetical protein [Pseudomonas typographi]MBD1602502.1 hypothetical protein [Pseudomonas typographi]
MTETQLKLAGYAIVALVLIGLGAGVGYWLTARHYQPIVTTAQADAKKAGEDLASCKTTRESLEGQVGEQNQAIAALKAAEQDREQKAKAAADQAHQDAQQDYQAANRLQQERTGGDPAATAAAIIDKELGL